MSATVLKRRATISRGPHSFLAAARRLSIWAATLGLLAGIAGSSWAPEWSAAATGKNKTLFVAVSNSYDAAVVEFNVVVDSFAACSAARCVSTAIEGPGDTRFYSATLALEKKGPYPSGISKDVDVYVGNLITIQKDVNAVARATTIPRQQSIVSKTL